VLLVDVPADFRFPESSWCLGYRYLIAALRADGFSAALLHPRARSALASMVRDIVRARPKIVGFTTYDVQLRPLLDFISELRAAGLRSHVTLGGLCASAIPEGILSHAPGVDSVVFGEGEEAIVDLARRIIRGEPRCALPGICIRDEARIVKGAPRRSVDDLDALVTPVMDDFRDRESAPLHLVNGCLPVMGSRGCYGRCSFCCIEKFYRAAPGRVWRGRSAGSIADEIASAGLTRVTFIDENFMGPGNTGRRHALDIAAEIRQRELQVAFNFGCRASDVDRATMTALKEAGLAAVTLGIESMSADALRRFNKHTSPEVNGCAIRLLEELGLFVEITFIFFHPNSTLEEIRQNLELVAAVARSHQTYFSGGQPFSELVPFFGTTLTRSLEEQGLVTRDLDGYSIRYADPRVGFIARRVLGVPVQRLSALRRMLPTDDRVTEINSLLLRAEIHLNMIRLPELVSDLCDLFERGAAVDSRAVGAAAGGFDEATAEIESLAARLLGLAA
jgi:radical SAM superfamily enzyme YgiQ (UPF0313 family)